MEAAGMGCSSRSRCGSARECEYCGRLRQAQIAGIAEKIEAQHGPLTITVLKPEENTAAAIRAVHASFMRRALAPAGLWTVETGELFGGLHLNIISPQVRAARWKKCQSYSELIKGTARDAAAYIAKRAGMPTPLQYQGRLYGSWGMIGAVLVREDMPPIVQGAALESVLSGVTIRGALPEKKEREGLTREQYRDIARRHLGNLREIARG